MNRVLSLPQANHVAKFVKNTIFDRWELAVADNVYIGNGSGCNIGVQTYQYYCINKVKNFDYKFICLATKKKPLNTCIY
jgi:hypothetical protein